MTSMQTQPVLPPPAPVPTPKPWNRARVTVAASTIVVLAVFATAYMLDDDRKPAPAPGPAAEESVEPPPQVKSESEFAEWYTPIDDFKAGFAAWLEKVVKFRPDAPQLKPTKGLANVSNLAAYSEYELSAEAKTMLEKNGFVVEPSMNAEYFALYESNRYSFKPNFVTTDAMLHEYHVLFDHLLENIERGALIGEAKLMTEGMLTASQAQYVKYKG